MIRLAIKTGSVQMTMLRFNPPPSPDDSARQAIAGEIWMHGDIARDVSRAEMEFYAGEMLYLIRCHAPPEDMENYVLRLQDRHVLRTVDRDVVLRLVDRCIAIARP
jgi:hypothetical protein